jgi:DeoR/GlpR family transcriptional regulator of sugar metabolism
MLAEIHIVHPKTIRRDLVRLESCKLPIHQEGRYFYLDRCI